MEKLILSKPTIQFTNGIIDTYFQPNMRARIISIEVFDSDEDKIKIYFDVEPFKDFNHQFEPINPDSWFHDSEFNEPPWIETIVMTLDEVDKQIKLIDDRSLVLYDKFCNQHVTDSYIEWLEQYILDNLDD